MLNNIENIFLCYFNFNILFLLRRIKKETNTSDGICFLFYWRAMIPQTCWRVHVAWKSDFTKHGEHSNSGTNDVFVIFSNILFVILSTSSNAELVTVDDLWNTLNVILKLNFVKASGKDRVTNTISSISNCEIARFSEQPSWLKAWTVTEFLMWERRSVSAYWEMLLESMLKSENPKLK